MLRLVLSILGYIGVLYIGASTFYISFKIVEALSNKSIKSSSRFLHFVSLHDYGVGISLWFFLMFVSVCAVFYLNADRRSESERNEDYRTAYEEGFSAGREDGYSAGRSEAIDELYDSRYDAGHDDGYSSGFEDGRTEGERWGYESGYDVGYEDGKYDGYNTGYEDGKYDGYNTGYEDGYSAGYATALEDYDIEP